MVWDRDLTILFSEMNSQLSLYHFLKSPFLPTDFKYYLHYVLIFSYIHRSVFSLHSVSWRGLYQTTHCHNHWMAYSHGYCWSFNTYFILSKKILNSSQKKTFKLGSILIKIFCLRKLYPHGMTWVTLSNKKLIIITKDNKRDKITYWFM